MKNIKAPGEMLKAHAHKHSSHKKKNWIAGAIKKPGALRHSLGVKAGHKIPAGKLATAASKGGKMGQRARLAETLKGFKHKGKEMGHMHKHAMKMLQHVAKHAMHAIDGLHKEHAKHMDHMMKGHAHKESDMKNSSDGFTPTTDRHTANANKKHAHKHYKKHAK